MKTGSFITTTVGTLGPAHRAGIVTELDWSGRSKSILARFADGIDLWLEEGEYTPVALALYDVDGTLTVSMHYNELRPEAVAHFQAFDWTRARIAFVTNQGGVGLRYWMEQGGFGNPKTYPTEAEVRTRLTALRAQIVDYDVARCPIYVNFAYQSKSSNKWAPTPFDPTHASHIAAATSNDEMVRRIDVPDLPDEWSPAFRKPSPGMLHRAMAEARVRASQTVMIGDSDEDAQAARAAGVAFLPAKFVLGFKDASDEPTPAYTFRYNPAILTDALSAEQMVGLDLAATTARFQREINEALSASVPVRNVTTFVADESLATFAVEPDPSGQMTLWIEGGLFINRDWLVYESAAAHAKALANALDQTWANHAVVLSIILTYVYGIGIKDADALVKQYKDANRWDNTRFVLGGR